MLKQLGCGGDKLGREQLLLMEVNACIIILGCENAEGHLLALQT
jgi:hypothetical protein